MEQLYVFGTGNATVTRCYNTCFALRFEEDFFMVDAGGGNGILAILEDMQVPLTRIHHIFVTHEHTDHILGILWMIRIIGQKIRQGTYQDTLSIYCHPGLIQTIATLCRLTTQEKIWKLLGGPIRLIPVEDGQSLSILGRKITFFDIHSTKAPQFGFTAELREGGRLTCAGDEPYHPLCRPYVEGSCWLLHEAFCLYKDREEFRPYEKHHSTVKEACELAQSMNIPNLVLWHTEDKGLSSRKEDYGREGRQYYSGNLFIPYDKEIIPLQFNNSISAASL